ncbi:hypothetical protein BD779DRAFT_1523311 [Infundibulicybe gibba]|nr:hypothetical protein BD779DRAFT_1523311 [Infundibulicybe gibba]
MADQAETAFARTFLNTLASQPVAFPDDYQAESLKKVPVLQVDVPPPPAPTPPAASTSTQTPLTLHIKSLKPPLSYTLALLPTDPVSALKARLAEQPGAPPAHAQRLLLRGKALADTKLLREYPLADGDTLNLAVKPNSARLPRPTARVSQHQRIPSVVLSPSPSSEAPPGAVERDITLTLDAATPPAMPDELDAYHRVVASPAFWTRVKAFLEPEFGTPADALLAFEDFLCAVKGALTPSEIARIRDEVGVVGMAGR